MKLALGPYIRFSRILLFPLAMVIYDFLYRLSSISFSGLSTSSGNLRLMLR